MILDHGLHLAYCTNIHRGESWSETWDALKNYTLAVRACVCPDKPFAIGLRLSNQAAQQLSDRSTLLEFQRWLEANGCYIFTINGFPYGQFHGARVKEQVYLPDWRSQERLDYTNLLFDLLVQLLPAGVPGSVSTVPVGFKELVRAPGEMQQIRTHLWQCVGHIARLSQETGRTLHLGLEPEPLCVLENTAEVIEFFDALRAEHPNDERLAEHLGVNYDSCHLAIEFEEPDQALGRLRQHGIKISKIHLSSALRVQPTPQVRQALAAFVENVYLHQVIIRHPDGKRTLYRDLDAALAQEPVAADSNPAQLPEWRIHFHIPLHSQPTALFGNTTDHLLGVFDVLQASPGLCSHLEMETYTWEVLPEQLRNRTVVEQLVAEYGWTLKQLGQRGWSHK